MGDGVGVGMLLSQTLEPTIGLMAKCPPLSANVVKKVTVSARDYALDGWFLFPFAKGS